MAKNERSKEPQLSTELIPTKYIEPISESSVSEGDTEKETALSKSVRTKIRTTRNNVGISIEKLAEFSNLAQSHISRIELGQCSPTVKSLEKICRALNISCRDLFDEDVVIKGENNNIDRITYSLGELSNEELELVYDIIQNILKLRQSAAQNSSETAGN